MRPARVQPEDGWCRATAEPPRARAARPYFVLHFATKNLSGVVPVFLIPWRSLGAV